MTTATISKFLGVSDERTECECCGRVNLKRTVVLSIRTADGDERVVYYGTDCARRELGLSAKRAAAAIEVANLAADLAEAVATLRARPDARELAVRTARADAHAARQSLLSLDWDASREDAVRRAYGALRGARAIAARAVAA